MAETIKNDWLQVSCTTCHSEALEEMLWAIGAQAITLKDAADNPVLEPPPGATPLWPQVRLTALFAGDQIPQQIEASLQQALAPEPVPALHYELLEDREWVREWLRYFQPMQLGQRLWILPGEAPLPTAADAVSVRLDPGLAFGTGTHPTTELCLRWLDGADLHERTVLDYGCGSGILAIAALRLGANVALATDIDPQALQASADNARRNQVEQRLQLYTPDALPQRPVDVLLANILSGPLIALAPTLLVLLKPGGSMVLSGLLDTQTAAVMQAYAAWIDWQVPRYKDGWACLAGVRLESPQGKVCA